MKQGKKWLVFGVVLACGMAAAVLIARSRGLSMDAGLAMNARYLSDGLFAAGLCMTGIGALTWVSTTGFFDIMGYGVKYGLRALIGIFGAHRSPTKSFYDYKVERDEKRGTPHYLLLLAGIVMIAVSAALLGVYYA